MPYEQRADRQVRRALAYVAPDPGQTLVETVDLATEIQWLEI
jgi:hypothetical protein